MVESQRLACQILLAVQVILLVLTASRDNMDGAIAQLFLILMTAMILSNTQ
jgi:hypothetical protein